MSRLSLIRPRRTRSVWGRPAADTRLLPTTFPPTVSLRPFTLPSWKYKAQRPLSTTAVRRHFGVASTLAASNRTWMPAVFRGRTPPAPFAAYGWMPALTRCRCSHGYPPRVPTSAVDACPRSPQMYFPQLTPRELSPPLWMPAPSRGGTPATPYPALRRLHGPKPWQLPTFRPPTPRLTP